MHATSFPARALLVLVNFAAQHLCEADGWRHFKPLWRLLAKGTGTFLVLADCSAVDGFGFATLVAFVPTGCWRSVR